jgi:membrane protease YdiL (CAAX protease family)
MKYQGGFAALVGGAALMGFIWGFVAYKTKSLRAVTIAHVAANFFAFSAMIYDNWFIGSF